MILPRIPGHSLVSLGSFRALPGCVCGLGRVSLIIFQGLESLHFLLESAILESAQISKINLTGFREGPSTQLFFGVTLAP